MDFVAKEKMALALGSPLRIGIGIASGTIAFSFALAGFMAKLAGMRPDMGSVDGSITTMDYL
jgi:hypothetical protein